MFIRVSFINLTSINYFTATLQFVIGHIVDNRLVASKCNVSYGLSTPHRNTMICMCFNPWELLVCLRTHFH